MWEIACCFCVFVESFASSFFQWTFNGLLGSRSPAGDRSRSQRRDRYGDIRSVEHVMKQPCSAIKNSTRG